MLKTGDRVRSGKKEGTLMGFQNKTQDLIVRDDAGTLYFFLQTMTEKIEEKPKKKRQKKKSKKRV